jgi:hypothetical protein
MVQTIPPRLAQQRDTRIPPRPRPQPTPPARPADARVRVVTPPTIDYPFGVIETIVGRDVAYYDVCELVDIEFQGCRAFHFVKHGPAGHEYDVLIAPNPQDHTCECKGFYAHGHCRHITAARFVAGQPSPRVVPDTRPTPADCPF